MIFKQLHWDIFREMDADPTPEQDSTGVNDATPIDTDNQQQTDMLPGIGDEAEVSTLVENVTGQENCQSISDVMHEDSVDSGSKAVDNMELILEDTNVRLKNMFIMNKNNILYV